MNKKKRVENKNQIVKIVSLLLASFNNVCYMVYDIDGFQIVEIN